MKKNNKNNARSQFLNKNFDIFLNILNSIEDGILISNTDCDIEYVNPSLIKSFGQPNNKKCYDYLNNRNSECPWCKNINVFKGETIRWEWHFLKNDKTYDIISSPLNNPDGSISKIEIFRDITEKKQFEDNREDFLDKIQQLSIKNQKQTDELNAIFSSITEPVLIYDTECNIIKFNKAVIKSFGFNPEGISHEKILNKMKLLLTNKKNSQLNNFIITRALQGIITRNVRYIFKNINGENKIALSSAAPIKSQNKIIGAVVVWHDITKQEKHEDILKKKQINLSKIVDQQAVEINEKTELMEKIFSNAQILIAYLDKEFNFMRVNPAFAKADKKETTFYTGKNYFDLYPDQQNFKIFKKVVETGQPYFAYAKSFEFFKNPEKGITYWDWSLQPINSSAGNIEGLILFQSDVTKRIKAEKELIEAQLRLNDEKRLSDIGKLAATVAHELRNPLGVINAALYNIERKNKNENLSRHISTIEKKIAESEQIINNLLNYSRIQIPTFEKIDIIKLIDESVNSVVMQYHKYNVKIIKNYDINKKIKIKLDAFQMKEVFNNIIINSFQSFAEKKGKIEIIIKHDNKHFIYIIFKDNGCGIDSEDIEKIFEPFFTRKSKGTGLGLSICKELIHLNNGTINIKSKINKGTEVIIELPLFGE